MSKIYIIGIDSSTSLKDKRQILERCGLIIASKRLAALLGNTFVPIHPIAPIAEALEQIEKNLSCGSVCVLASGDPLFYGIAGKLIKKFGKSQVEVLPALSSMQEAFARFKLSWDDAAIISLHGRTQHHLPGLLLQHHKVFLFTDKINTPDCIATSITDYLDLIGAGALKDHIIVHVAENIGAPDEKIFSGSLFEAAHTTFSDFNVVCLLIPEQPAKPGFGFNIDEIQHSRGLITKDEVRAVTLHRLRFPSQGIFWDIGGGSGSISLEAAAMNPQLTVYCIEHRPEEVENIKANIRKFSLFNIIPVSGRAKDVIAELPAPDRVFIGGSDGEMDDIIAECSQRIAPSGRIVANGVIEKTITQTPAIMQQYGFNVSSSTVSITRNEADGAVALNPITIITGTK